MSTHSVIGVSHSDGRITACYVHMDGYPEHMVGALQDFIAKKSTTGLIQLIVRAQMAGGIRSFWSPLWNSTTSMERETELLDDRKEYVIDEMNWNDDQCCASYTYLVDYESGKITEWSKYPNETA